MSVPVCRHMLDIVCPKEMSVTVCRHMLDIVCPKEMSVTVCCHLLDIVCSCFHIVQKNVWKGEAMCTLHISGPLQLKHKNWSGKQNKKWFKDEDPQFFLIHSTYCVLRFWWKIYNLKGTVGKFPALGWLPTDLFHLYKTDRSTIYCFSQRRSNEVCMKGEEDMHKCSSCSLCECITWTWQ